MNASKPIVVERAGIGFLGLAGPTRHSRRLCVEKWGTYLFLGSSSEARRLVATTTVEVAPFLRAAAIFPNTVSAR